METLAILTVIAIVMGPILAVQAQKISELVREKRIRKVVIFKTLMATRASRVSFDHVKALNMIDIEFYGKRILGVKFQSNKYNRVTLDWKTYHDNLNAKDDDTKSKTWLDKNDELFIDLLFEISGALGYDFDKIQLKRGAYSPIAHGEQEIDALTIRRSLSKILSGEEALPMKVVSMPGYKLVPIEDSKEDNTE